MKTRRVKTLGKEFTDLEYFEASHKGRAIADMFGLTKNKSGGYPTKHGALREVALFLAVTNLLNAQGVKGDGITRG